MSLFRNFKKHTAHCIWSLMLLQIFLPMAQAQEKSSLVNTEFSCVIWKKLPYDELYYRQGAEYFPLALLANNRSQLYPLKGMEALELYIPALDEKGQPIYTLVGKGTFPLSANRIIFFIVQRGGEALLPLGLLGIDDSLEGFPPGTTRFVNMSNLSLKVGFGSGVTNMKPRAMTTIESKAPSDGGFMPFLVTDENGKRVFETRLMSQPNGRDMVFILPSDRVGRPISLRFVPQVISPKRSSGSDAP
jgi:hypothetical protein